MKLFTKVHCKSYLKRVHDGVHLELYHIDGTLYLEKTVDSPDWVKAFAYTADGKEIEMEFDGGGVQKTYRSKVPCEFDGMLVGITTVKTAGEIGLDWEYSDNYSYGHVFKTTTETEKVGVVYYRNNTKRYVPLSDMEVIE